MTVAGHPPNILWITTDRQRFDTLGTYGNEWVTTPNLDQLARDGARLEQAWCQSPICAPSRASFLTGRYPRTAGINRNGQRLRRSERIVPRLLLDAGYVCGLAGKLHLAPSSSPIADWSEPRGDDGYATFDWSMHPPDTPVSQYTAWLFERGLTFAREPVDGSPYVSFGMDEHTSNTSWIAQRAVNFIHLSSRLDRPWFFTMNIEDPHDPFDPPRRFLEPYLARLDEIPLPVAVDEDLRGKPEFQRIDRAGVWGSGRGRFAAERMSARDHRMIRAAYWAMIDHIDYQVGRVVDALRETDQLGDTLIVFMSDHGEMLGDHGIYFQGAYFYEPMMHVPLLVQWPGRVAPGTTIGGFVELVDVAPTLLAAAGAPEQAGMQGRSLLPLLCGEDDANGGRDSVYFEYYQAIPDGYRDVGGARLTGVRSRDWALTAVHDTREGELYDLRLDPCETTNLWDAHDHMQVKASMLALLADRMAATIDPLPPTEASY